MTASLPPPLGGSAPEEKPLANSPLVRVLVQARFASILKIDSKEGVAPNQIGVALPEYREYVSQAISEANLRIEEGDMLMRWGIIPKNATIDPGLVDPVGTASWLLDIDASSSEQRPFEAESLAAIYQKLSERAYAVFRWVMTDKGLAHFERG